ncbi:microfibrillar-associated protein 2 isoform X2 [Spea bombifrons]|nr:microfibrillar-associated protein 2 isoform X2 [Spea bombifrons]XP_053308113.1 microfibrillar-associated protein 2 isoform X2 [Spea bombifrons]XP_053308114.1 microfibrillar-associated protein 2 isoform X2 [Spea bombifrons]
MRFACLLVFCVHGIIAQQYDSEHYSPSDIPFYYDYEDPVAGQLPGPDHFQVLPQQSQTSDQHQLIPQQGQQQVLEPYDYQPQQQQQQQQEIIPVPTQDALQTEPTEPGPLDCREEQYPCTRLYSVHKPCKQCLNEICFYSLRRMYVINKEICVRTVCAHEELLRADMCRDKFSRCGVMATSGMCNFVESQCSKSCGGC